MKIVVCDIDNRESMVHRCGHCPGAAALQSFLENKLEELGIHDVTFNQWQTTDRPTIITQSTDDTNYI